MAKPLKPIDARAVSVSDAYLDPLDDGALGATWVARASAR